MRETAAAPGLHRFFVGPKQVTDLDVPLGRAGPAAMECQTGRQEQLFEEDDVAVDLPPGGPDGQVARVVYETLCRLCVVADEVEPVAAKEPAVLGPQDPADRHLVLELWQHPAAARPEVVFQGLGPVAGAAKLRALRVRGDHRGGQQVLRERIPQIDVAQVQKG